MPEAGGPTTQSGIRYQNSLAALYLGRMLDLRTIPGEAKIASIRVEAPDPVDDIVVEYADGTRLHIQAKEALATSGEVWRSLWQSVLKQRAASRTARCSIIVGTYSAELDALREACARSRGKNDGVEWVEALSQVQLAIIGKVSDALGCNLAECWPTLNSVAIEFETTRNIETIGVRDWVPESSVGKLQLLSLLRDESALAARGRATFTAFQLLEVLRSKYDVRIYGSTSDGLEHYLGALATQVRELSVPGADLQGPEVDLFVWPEVSNFKSDESDFEQEDHRFRHYDISAGSEAADISRFPALNNGRIILEAGAGFGKTTILRALCTRIIAETPYVPIFTTADELQSWPTLEEYGLGAVNKQYGVTIDWAAVINSERAVLFLDGLDEVDDVARIRVMDLVSRVSGRHASLPIILAARNSSLIAIPHGFTRLSVLRFSDEKVKEGLRNYLQKRNIENSDKLQSSIFKNPDLRSICRIPLFLAMLVGTLPKSGVLPRSRSELIERYLGNLLAPQRHKRTKPPGLSVTILRRAAESMAMLALRRSELSIDENVVRSNAAGAVGAEGDIGIDELLRCGLVKRRGSRIHFDIATVAEYLAGCALASQSLDGAGEWFRKAARRPWAQALQFALERIDSVEDLVERQLDEPDDYFRTTLRIVGRVIANGAQVNFELREKVACKLAASWGAGTYSVRQAIGRVIADGFARPPNDAIREAMCQPRGFLEERPEVLRIAADGELTVKCLSVLLSGPDIRELWHEGWSEAIRNAGSPAADLLLSRALSESDNSLEASVLAKLLRSLEDMPSLPWDEILGDERYPLPVRAAAVICLSKQEEKNGRKIILEAMSASRFGFGTDFSNDLLAASWWQEEFAAACREHSESERLLSCFLATARPGSTAGIRLLEVIANASNDPDVSAERKLLFCGILMGAKQADKADAISGLLNVVDGKSLVDSIIWRLAGTVSNSLLILWVEIVRERDLPIQQQIEIVEDLARRAGHVAVHPQRDFLLSGPFVTTNADDPLCVSVVSWIQSILDNANLPPDKLRPLVAMAADMNSSKFIKSAVRLFDEYLQETSAIETEEWNSWFASVLWLIEKNPLYRNTDRLWSVMHKSNGLPTHSVIATLDQIEGSAFLEKAVALFNNSIDSSLRGDILFWLDEVSPRRGLTVRIEAGILVVAQL
ncbi:NACHT domain-containing protein [Devosia sp. SL43]|uniref:NACHT domain-containing protein n=1 Tax=Devosia sp. SL43 TaxID=2806348 RepID=UPI001F20A8F6|nr:hypothetical protein [Devosia sp. SL43]UJW84648.1 hypothetical protein IM737_14610 [Devosia sp. SL43]